jgi:hypothetical protein
MHKMELVLQSLKCAGYEFGEQIKTSSIKMLMMKIWNKNTSCRIEFKFFLLSTNVCVIVGVLNVIDIALIPRETTLDVNSYPAHGNIGVGSACGWLSCYLKYQPV